MDEQPGIMTETNAPPNAAGFDENGVVSRINEINQGATPVLKPTGKSSQALVPPVPPASSSGQTKGKQVQLENLDQDYMQAKIKTNFGDITVEFYATESPIAVNNFLNLAQQGFYDGTRFHRVIKNFMIQGGDPLSKDLSEKEKWGTGGPGYKFQDEINDHPLQRGSFAMANSGPNTNGSQFFIVTAQFTPWLDGKHTNFGYVTEGMDTVDKIEAVESDENDCPKEDVIINNIELLK
jgi:cyclophilin family peptidyl-prolyl cis-trans isomerase